MNEVQEQFLKTLENLKALAKTKKNTLEYDEILNAFNGMELTDAKIDMVLEYLEKNHVDILQGKSPEDMPDDMLLESEEDILLSDNEEIELINDVDILEGVSTEDPVRMYLKEIGKPSTCCKYCQEVCRKRYAVSGSDPGGQHGPDEGCGQV